jgi:hypothetical protein
MVIECARQTSVKPVVFLVKEAAVWSIDKAKESQKKGEQQHCLPQNESGGDGWVMGDERGAVIIPQEMGRNEIGITHQDLNSDMNNQNKY